MADLKRTQPLARDAMAYVLAGGRGSRLLELTDWRAKPAVYFGGKSRIIDFALSNALNSGIRRIGVATQYKAHSLIRHLQRGWNFFRQERNESFDILPASQRVSETRWLAGRISNPSLRSGRKKFHPRCRWRIRLCALYCVATPIRRMPELSAFDSAKSMIRALPPK